MKSFNKDNRDIVKKRIDDLRSSFSMYDRYEIQSKVLNVDKDEVNRVLLQIEELKKIKASSIYSMLKKYGWPLDISKSELDIIIKVLKYGEVEVLLKIAPYVKYAFLMGYISEEDFNKIFDIINDKEKLIDKNKTFK